MKNIIKLLKIIALLLFAHNSFSQDVKVEIQSLQYTVNGQPTITASDCGNIDFGSGSTISINFGISLKKPSTLAVGNGEVKVFTKKSSSDAEVQRQLIIIQSGSWTNGDPATISTTGNITLNSSDFNTTGGTLYVTYTSASDLKYKSCDYSIGKPQPPTFVISPTEVSVGCNSTTPVTFTVNNLYNSPGTLTYYWTAYGWVKDGVPVGSFTTTTNSVTLVPNSYPPSSVYVWPVLNGVTQAQKYSSLSLAPFTSFAAISGNNSLCTNATYAITGLQGRSVSYLEFVKCSRYVE